MRIIGGIAAGRLLKVPGGLAVRPTPDIVKQAVFNRLGARVAGARVLELFAGSGALGLECLSRGAAEVVAVERASRHAAFIRANLTLAGLEATRFELRTQDVFPAVHQLAAAGRSFDLILADPPFGEKNVGRRSTSASQALLDEPALPRLLARGGVFVLGHTHRDTLTITPAWRVVKQLHHGDSMMTFLEKVPGDEPSALAVVPPVEA
ncbi:MAG: 16S rRNA (guanine(966)-N(2))-methyltransferase RsmD [Verrucomicrobia bacterium]|jgi:16S rRNA (guanine966-N2)-methyltransferase|nr:16S rRNA (guanine(966)-N(2))-methyltransferase RsmD [Verrucomicrobiota bacterium]